MVEYLYLLLVGLLAGLSSGLLGVGGSIVILPFLALLFPQQSYHQHAAAAMIVNSFASLAAAWRHYRVGHIQIAVIKRMIPAAILGICLGVWLSNLPLFTTGHPEYLPKILALFLIYVAVINIRKLFSLPGPNDSTSADLPPSAPSWRALIPGLMMGLPAGLLGIGGGVIAVPAQQVVLRIRLRNAIANSSGLIVFSAAVGAFYKNWTLSTVAGASVFESFRLVGLLIPTAIVGSYFGARLMHISPIAALRTVFICYLLWAGYSQWTAGARSPSNLPQHDRPAAASRDPADSTHLGTLIPHYRRSGARRVSRSLSFRVPRSSSS